MPWSPEAYHRFEREMRKENVQKKYDQLSHPAMGRKEDKVQTLEEQKQELEDSLVQSRHQEYVRIEMDKIRKEGWKEESTTDTHKIIYEAERRVNASKDIK